MTDRELWATVWAELTLTTDSYPLWKSKGFPANTHWAKAKALGDQIGVVAPPPPPPPPPPLPPPPSPVVTDLPRYGISTGAIYSTWSAATLDFACKKMAELAQGHPFAVRYDAWDAGATFTRTTDAVLAHGLTPYIVLYASGGPRAADNLGRDIAAKYKGRGLVFTGPNEPDLHGWQPDQLADFQKAMYASVKAGDPDALCGASGLWKGNGVTTSPQAFMRAYCTRAKGSFDFFQFHGYDDPTQMSQSWCIWAWIFPGGYQHPAGNCVDIMHSLGVNVPILSDECGGQITDADQGGKVVKMLDQAKNGRVAGSYIFSLLPDYDGKWYIINADRSERPAFTAYKQFMAALP